MNVHIRPAEGREAEVLRTRRLCKIAASPLAYVRGSTVLFYEWMGELPPDARPPEGPPIWICGDCHLGNIGALADPEGRVRMQIRDLDQSVVANPAFDLVRLTLSLVTAGLAAPLSGLVVARMIEAIARGYAAGLEEPEEPADPDEGSTIVETTRRNALGRRWRHLSEERLRGKTARLPRGKRFFDLDPDERTGFAGLLHHTDFAERVLGIDAAEGPIELVDAAYWIKGCSSLGRLRLAGLVRIPAARGRARSALIDVKEAVPYLAPASPGAGMPDDPAERVVVGARALSPALGERLIAGRVGDTSVIVRELLPQDLKIDAEQFSKGEGVRVARSLAAVVGRSHGRQLPADARRAWRAQVEAEGWDARAPHWLWSSVTALMGRHQSGYLAHCRDVARDENLAPLL